MAKFSEFIEQLYIAHRYRQKVSTRGSEARTASTLRDLGQSGRLDGVHLGPGVRREDWPELPAHLVTTPGPLVEDKPARSEALLLRYPQDLAARVAELPLPLEALAVVAFDTLEIRLPGVVATPGFPGGAHDQILQDLNRAGWQIRGFRSCEVTPGGGLRLRGAWLEKGGVDGSAKPGLTVTISENAPAQHREEGGSDLLLALLDAREQKVERYRRTDEKRQRVHQKLKQRLKAVRAERRALRREVARLQQRTEQLKLRVRHFQTAKKYFQRLAGLRAAGGVVISPYVQKTPLETVEDLLDRSSPWTSLRQHAWSYWMRLGVLFQYEPRHIQPDKLPTRSRSRSGPGKARPRISIITPSYQQAPFLERTLESVLGQKYPELEYLVLDGGSTDGSREILEKHADRLTWWRSERDNGQAAAVAEGLARTTGDIMAWINSDDVYLPGALDFVAHYFQTHPEVDVVYGHRILIDSADWEVGRWVLPPHDPRVLRWVDYVPQESMFWRRGIYEKAGGLDPSLGFAMDWDLLLRFQKAGARIVRLPYYYSAFRVHEAQKSATLIGTMGLEEVTRLRKRELGGNFSQEQLNRVCTQYQLRALMVNSLLSLGIRI